MRLPDAYSLLTMTLGALETDPPHEMSCLSETKATIRRESGARVALSCVHTFRPRGRCRPHVSPDRASFELCVAVSACRARNTSPRLSPRLMSGFRRSRPYRGTPGRECWKQEGNQQLHDS